VTAWPWIIAPIAGFVSGSIPFGLLIGRIKGVDVRKHGSRNIGATNVGRVLGRPLGYLCFVLDALKGALPVLVAGVVLVEQVPDAQRTGVLMPLIGIAAILGHIYSPWVSFKGGKGVATSFGALLAMWPLMTFPALGALAVWLAVVKVTHYVSAASMLAALALPLLLLVRARAWPGGEPMQADAFLPLLIAVTLLAALVIWKHRANIARLRAGTELRVGGATGGSGAARSTQPPRATSTASSDTLRS
jgi:glycerol-3-phosphate acyltransferase PlsY